MLIVFGALLGVLIAVPGVSTAADTFKDVFVTNDSDHPIPTAAQGTTQAGGTVNIGNAPTVNVGSNASDREPYEHTVFFNQTGTTCTQFSLCAP